MGLFKVVEKRFLPALYFTQVGFAVSFAKKTAPFTPNERNGLFVFKYDCDFQLGENSWITEPLEAADSDEMFTNPTPSPPKILWNWVRQRVVNSTSSTIAC